MNFLFFLVGVSVCISLVIDRSCSKGENGAGHLLFRHGTKPRNKIGKKLDKWQSVSNSFLILEKDDVHDKYDSYWKENEKDFKKYSSIFSSYDKKEIYCLAKVGGLGLKNLKLIILLGLKSYWILKSLGVFIVLIPLLLTLIVPRPIVQVIFVNSSVIQTSSTTTTTPITTTTIPTTTTTPTTTITTSSTTSTTPTTTTTTTTSTPSIPFTCPPCTVFEKYISLPNTTGIESANQYVDVLPVPLEVIEAFENFKQSCIERIICISKTQDELLQKSTIKWKKEKVSRFVSRILESLSPISKQQIINRIIFQDIGIEFRDCEIFECKNFKTVSNFFKNFE